MAVNIIFKQIGCDTIEVPFNEDDQPLNTVEVDNWITPFQTTFYVKALKAPYGGNFAIGNREFLIGYPEADGHDGGFQSLGKGLTLEHGSCYSLDTSQNSRYIRFTVEAVHNFRTYNEFVVKTMPNNGYLIEFLSPNTEEMIRILVWKPL